MIPVADQRIRRATPATLAVVWSDQDGDDADPTAPVTVGVTRADGTVLVAPGTAAAVADSTVTVALSVAQTAILDWLTATWTDAAGVVLTTVVEVVGGYYLSIGDIRALKNIESNFDAVDIIEARRWFEDGFEQYCGTAFVRRYRLISVWGEGKDYIDLPDRNPQSPLRLLQFGLIQLTGIALSNTVVTADGRLQRYFPYFSNATDDQWGRWSDRFPAGIRITVGYEHGLSSPPGRVRDAAKVAIRDKLLTDNTGSRDYAQITEVGTVIRSSLPGPGRPFGIPYVDRIANEMRERYGRPDQLASVPIG
jgi:hypothetical protein